MHCILIILPFVCVVAVIHAAETTVSDPAQFEAAVKTAKAGDAILLSEGEWKDADLRFKAYGTAEKPVTLKAKTPGKTTFTGKSRIRIGGEHLVVEGLHFQNPLGEEAIEMRIDSKLLARDCRVTQCAVTNTLPAVKGGNSARFVSIYGQRNRIDHCRFEGKTTEGTTMVVWLNKQTPGDGQHRIDSNYFGPREALGENGGETIRVGDSDTSLQDARCVVERNLFERCNGEGEIISNKSCANIYRQNVFIECEGALTLRHGNRCVVDANWFLGNHKRLTGGVRVIGEDHIVTNNYIENTEGDDMRSGITFMAGIVNTPLNGYAQVKRALIAHNTLIGCKSSILIGIKNHGATLPPVETVIANNVIVNEKRALVSIVCDGADVKWSGNIMRGKELGIPADEGIREVDPMLERCADGVSRPVTGSPVIGAAATLPSAPQHDIDGQPRGAKADAGCDQVSTAAIKTKRVTRAEVGPSW